MKFNLSNKHLGRQETLADQTNVLTNGLWRSLVSFYYCSIIYIDKIMLIVSQRSEQPNQYT